MSKLGTITRRAFLIGSAAVAGGAAFGYYKYRQPLPNPQLADLAPGATALTPYVRIDARGVTIITPRAEMGQGVHTTLAALVAEELDVSWDSIRVEHGMPGAAYYNEALISDAAPVSAIDEGRVATTLRASMGVASRFLGIQVTGGSSTVADAFDKMRVAGAAARFALVAAAAARLNVPAASLSTRDGMVIAPDGKRISYIDLAAAAAAIELPEAPPLKPRAQWRYLGKSMPRVDMLAKCTGTAVFGIDVRHPGMLFASVRMNPALGSPLRSFDAAAAKKMRGVMEVVPLPGGVAVVANNTWRAFAALKTIVCDWAPPAYPATTDALMTAIAASFDDDYKDSRLRDDGDVEHTLAAAAAGSVLEREYRVPFLAHATMEPMNAVAWFKGDELHIWSGVQAPTLARNQAADVSGLDVARVHVHTTLMGGGFGRRLESDFVVQAVRVAMATKGRPVKLTWTREEDMTQDMYRPAAIARFRGMIGGTTAGGTVRALDVRVASPSVLESQGGRIGLAPPGPDKLIVDGVFDQPYGIAHYRATGYRTPALLPVSSWRSVGNSYNGFFMESFIDELAVHAKADPMAMRLALLDHAPSRKVLEAVAAMSGWGAPLAQGRGRGVALHYSFGVPTAYVVEVTHGADGVKVDRVFVAADVGIALDPRNVEAQLQSGVIFGLSAAIFGEITFVGGAAQQSNFHQYEALRMVQSPRIAVQVLQGGGPIRGVGETGVPPAAPALANAIFNATGQRIRELPLKKHIAFL